jgi:hypothetical protein
MPNAPFPITNLFILKIMVKDKISLIAAAAGGFMLFVAMSGILQGAPVMALRSQHIDSTKVADLQLQKIHPDEPIDMQQRFPIFFR